MESPRLNRCAVLLQVIDRWPELVAERLQSLGCLGSNATGGLYVEDDVDVVGRTQGVNPAVDAKELGHQSTNERPLLVREHSFDRGYVRPRRSQPPVDRRPISYV
jgi:hypothetical protein